MRILLVEDQFDVKTVISAWLELRHGFEVEIVSRGDEAQEAFIAYQPDVILMDIRLPFMNGIEAIKEIRVFSDVPIIVISAHGSQPTRQAAAEAGADAFLEKPPDMPRLVGLMRQLLHQRGRADEAEIQRAETTVLIRTHKRRLDRLQEKAAAQGLDTPPATLIEIEDIEKQIEELMREL